MTKKKKKRNRKQKKKEKNLNYRAHNMAIVIVRRLLC